MKHPAPAGYPRSARRAPARTAIRSMSNIRVHSCPSVVNKKALGLRVPSCPSRLLSCFQPKAYRLVRAGPRSLVSVWSRFDSCNNNSVTDIDIEMMISEIDNDLVLLANQVRGHKSLPPLAQVVSSTRLREDLGFNSLDLAEFTVRIEERFGVDVFADGIVTTFGEVRDKVARSVRR